MSEILHEQQPVVRLINPYFVEKRLDEFHELANLIPEVEYQPEDLLAEEKPDGRKMYAKWQHSYAVTKGDSVVGFIMGYERGTDWTANYPSNTLYISELAVKPEEQGKGLARDLLHRFIKDARSKGFSELSGPLNFSVQTNAAEWNQPVRKLYETFGFIKVGEKKYENRTDAVMRVLADKVLL